MNRAMREASNSRTVTDTDSCAFCLSTNLMPTRGRPRHTLIPMKQKLLKNLVLLATIFTITMTACSGEGVTLSELDKMSQAERMPIESLKLKGITGNGELDLYNLLTDFSSLKNLEIDSDFQGALDRSRSLKYCCPNLTTIKANGVKIIKESLFRGSSIQSVEMKNVREIGRFVFNKANNISFLDFPNAEKIGYQAFYTSSLTTLKLGSGNRINCNNAFKDTESIDLYLGKYEFENNVNGNEWTVYAYAEHDVIDMNAMAYTGKPVVVVPQGEWYKIGTYRFKSIQKY